MGMGSLSLSILAAGMDMVNNQEGVISAHPDHVRPHQANRGANLLSSSPVAQGTTSLSTPIRSILAIHFLRAAIEN